MTTAVLFTGSRYAQIAYAPHKSTIWNALRLLDQHMPGDKVLFEGEAQGADTIARISAEHLGWAVEKYPADWDTCDGDDCTPEHRSVHTKPAAKRGQTFCPTAGTRRNQKMIDTIVRGLRDGTHTAALCIGTPLGAFSRDTQDCMRRATDAGIEVNRYPLPIAPPKRNRTKPEGKASVHH